MASILELYEGLTPLKMDEDLYNIYSFLKSQNLDYDKTPFFTGDTESIINETKSSLTDFFSLTPVLHPKQVSYLTSFFQDIATINPFELPTYFSYSKYLIGDTITARLYDQNQVAYYVFARIILKYFNDTMASSIYAHEIVHTQISPNRLLNFYNSEVVSIFVEKLVAQQKSPKVFQTLEKIRLQNLFICLESLMTPEDILDYHDSSNFVISTLKAEKLFAMYINGSEKDKALIIAAIQDVFCQKQYVEDMLDNLGIGEENSFNTVSIKRNLGI